MGDLLNQRLVDLFPEEVGGYQARERRMHTRVATDGAKLPGMGWVFPIRTYEKAGLASINLQLEAGASRMTSKLYCDSSFPIPLKAIEILGHSAKIQEVGAGERTICVCLENGGALISGRNATEEQLLGFAKALGTDFIAKVESVAKLP